MLGSEYIMWGGLQVMHSPQLTNSLAARDLSKNDKWINKRQTTLIIDFIWFVVSKKNRGGSVKNRLFES